MKDRDGVCGEHVGPDVNNTTRTRTNSSIIHRPSADAAVNADILLCDYSAASAESRRHNGHRAAYVNTPGSRC